MIVTGHPHDAKVQVPKGLGTWDLGLQPDLPLTGRMLFPPSVTTQEDRWKAGFKASDTSKNGLLGGMKI